MVVYRLHVRYVTLSASNEPESSLEGKWDGDHWCPLMSLAFGVNQFALLRSGVHNYVLDPLQCLVLFFLFACVLFVNESVHV
jgi:hypothetical protein